MNYRNVLYLTSILLLVIGIGLLASLGVAFVCHDSQPAIHGLVICTLACLSASVAGILFSRRESSKKSGYAVLQEGFTSVLFAWVAAIIFGSMPFFLCCDFAISDAIFETASGLSTTGATIIEPGMRLLNGDTLVKGLEGLPKSILFWRTLLNWLGGIGFVMFVLMMLPALGGGKQLYNAEVPGLKSAFDQETPRIGSTARLMMGCYVLWTVLVATAYRFLGMDNWFDAICHTFSTVATGGFGNYTDSFGHFSSPALQWASTIAMFISACNFTLMLKFALKGKFEYHRDEEFRTFFFIVLAATLIFTIQLHSRPNLNLTYTDNSPLPQRWEPLLRTSAFQVVSIISTTGFSTSDYTQWGPPKTPPKGNFQEPTLATQRESSFNPPREALPGLPTLMLILMLVGGCGGSTAGGLKVARLIVVTKQSFGEVRRKLSPHLMPNVLLNHTRLEMPVVRQTMAFVVIYFSTLGICTFLLPYLSEMDFETALSAAISAIGNVGPGLSKVGPSATYAWMTPAAKSLLSFTMIAGRLELYTALVVILPSFWRSRR